MSAGELVLPEDYYAAIFAVERGHWWHRGLREVAGALLGDRLARAREVLDAGCGTGGFLAWAGEQAPEARLLGADLSWEAVTLARSRVPAAELHVAPLHRMPFDDGAADLVTCNDVLQHVLAADLDAGVAELRRVTRPGGAVVVRTGAARTHREEREDWRIFDAGSLRSLLARGGLNVERVTHVNALGSAWATARGRSPRAPTHERHGIPEAPAGRPGDPRLRLLAAEAAWLARPGRTLPFGHTLLAVAMVAP